MIKYKPIIAVTESTNVKKYSWDWWSWECIRLGIWLAGGIAKRITPTQNLARYDGLLLGVFASIIVYVS